jgi:hypothetical protein
VSETSIRRAVDPQENPSYPQRTHTKERPQWQALLKVWDERVDAAGKSLGSRPDREAALRLYVQMRGARDQLADAVRRLPMEVGDLYEEDRARVDEAVAALERLFTLWDKK